MNEATLPATALVGPLGRPGRPMAGEGGGAGPPSWADVKGEGVAGPKGKKGGEREKEKVFLFLYLFFYMNAFTLSNNQKNAWFGMVQQIKEINSRVYHYHMT